MDPADEFSAAANPFRCWDLRVGHPNRLIEAAASLLAAQVEAVPPGRGELEEMFQAYGVSTLAAMREEELEDMMAALCHVFRWELLVGERYGIKAAVRTERRRRQLDGFFQLDEEEQRRRRQVVSPDSGALDALSQEGLSEERVQQEREAVASGGEAWEGHKKKKTTATRRNKKTTPKKKKNEEEEDGEEEEDDDDDEEDGEGECEGKVAGGAAAAGGERQREHPFIVTEPGEVARGKKNGLDYLFHLYDQCRDFLLQVQSISRERGHKCPTKVREGSGASYINKPKMRHYVHCYALHCLDEEASNALRRAWRQACYQPLVALSARHHGWDVDALFNSHPGSASGTCPPSSASSATSPAAPPPPPQRNRPTAASLTSSSG
ncbi:unnamed protein product [Spirodela intermedia]|uniref:Floricaula/leafy-like transcription factor n=1 Tax=Spirodela intermedia TaxID=51605 RepID=A0A7I8IJC3_SPIIN|nr:unnamed protein product [Spirodela intermedia]CAA6657938.1 unnamed protein product [Spirodela intermedia]